MTFTAAVASNALTVTTDAGSLVISSGDTRGAVSGVPFRLWVTNNGALSADLGIGPGFMKRPFRPLGSLTWESGLPVAGQWSANPTVAAAWQPGDPLPGDILEEKESTDPVGVNITSSGFTDSLLIASVTPQSATEAVDVFFNASISMGADTGFVGIFRGGLELGNGNNSWVQAPSSNYNVSGYARDFPNAAALATYKVRGRTAGATTMRIHYTGGWGGQGILKVQRVSA